MGHNRPFFFPNNQITAQIANDMDWSKHSLGEPSSWPASLKLTLNTLFNTRHAVSLFWGEENFYFYNDAYIPMLGNVKHPWAMGRRGEEVWKEVWSFLGPHIEKVMKKGASTWFEDQYVPIHRPGYTVEAYFTYSYSPIIDEDGKIRGTLVISIENTGRVLSERKVKATQKELVEALAKFKLMSESLPQLVWTALPDGRCNYLSKQWIEYTGIPESDQLGSKWLELVVHPDDRSITQSHWKGATLGLHPYDLEYRLKRFDGKYRWFKVRGIPFRDSDDKVLMWFGTCTDIDDSKVEQMNYEKNVDQSPAMLWITEPDGYCSYLSNQWHTLTGQSVREGLGYGWLDMTHPDDKERTAVAFMEANKKHAPFKVEYRLRNHDGIYRWAIDAGNPRFGSHGEYLGMAGTVFDVHEKKLAEEALKESRSDLYRVLMQAPAAVAFLKGPDLVYNLANSRYRSIFEKDEDLIGQSMRAALPEISERSHRIFEDVYKTGIPYFAKEYKSTVKSHVDGNEVYFNFAVQRINNILGQAEGVIVIGDDVTEQVKDRLAREELTRQLEAIVENMIEGLMLADQTGKILIWNPAVCSMYGFKNNGDTFFNYAAFREMIQVYSIDGDLLDFSDWPLASALRGESFTNKERIVEKLDTGDRWIGSYNGSPIFNKEGKVAFAIVTVRDVTSRLESERVLKNAINSRDEFLSVVSHELKTPLTSLKLQNQSAMRKILKGSFADLTPDKLLNLFDKNESQINRVTRLVDDMLDMTRIQSGKFSYNFVKCDLCMVAIDVYERFREQYENADTILLNDCIEAVEGYFDQDRIEQVIVNLLTNALKYGLGKPVTLRMEKVGNAARLEVLDHGMGIPPENFSVIFNKYERGISADEVSGLGIGLFISREIVEAHGGRIWVESKVGEGSKFIAELPLDANNLK